MERTGEPGNNVDVFFRTLLGEEALLNHRGGNRWFVVEDLEAACARVKELGGEVMDESESRLPGTKFCLCRTPAPEEATFILIEEEQQP